MVLYHKMPDHECLEDCPWWFSAQESLRRRSRGAEEGSLAGGWYEPRFRGQETSAHILRAFCEPGIVPRASA
jgi:hypothetical protein